MSLPAGYSYDNDGWIWKNDGTGPYSVSSLGVVALLGTSIESVSTAGFSQGASGLYFFTDGSGPYAKGSGGMYKLLG